MRKSMAALMGGLILQNDNASGETDQNFGARADFAAGGVSCCGASAVGCDRAASRVTLTA